MFAALTMTLTFVLLPQQPTPPLPTIDADGVPGTRMICGGGRLPAAVMDRFFELAGGANARIVLIPTATSVSIDDPATHDKYLADWRKERPGSFTLLHTRDRAVADGETFCAPLREATGVWLGGGQQDRLATAYLGTRVERELHALLARGGVIGGTSAGAAIQSRIMIAGGRGEPELATGFDFAPGAIVDQHFLVRNRLPRLRRAVERSPGRFGIGIDEGTCVELSGRRLRVLGASSALLVLPVAGGCPERIDELHPGDVADLVTWQRAARQRARGLFPAPVPRAPEVGHGALIIAGGGRLPPDAIARFVELAGGAQARIVVVPTAGGDGIAGGPFVTAMRARGVEQVTVFHVPAGHDQAGAIAQSGLEQATGIWFEGGRQWRLVDAYEGTRALELFHGVLARGGVIGGSSAGASIQAEFMVRGNPLGNAEMACEGYEQGFGFLPGCAIDQHFDARNRTGDMAALIARFPQLLGIGIGEHTAIEVRGTVLRVFGAAKVALFDERGAPRDPALLPVPTELSAGETWHLRERRRL